jgi:hypothetical protein
MMDAGIGGAVMNQMMAHIAQGAQVRLLAQEPVHNIPGLQGLQDTVPPTVLDKMAKQVFDAFNQTFAKEGNVWGILKAEQGSYQLTSSAFQVDITLTRRPFIGDYNFRSTLSLEFDPIGQSGPEWMKVTGSTVMTDGEPDSSLFLLQTALLCIEVRVPKTTQANQAFLPQSHQLDANLQAAVDHIFSARSHQVDQVVHNIPGLQGLQDTVQAGRPGQDGQAGL